jgi:hypothetical protein
VREPKYMQGHTPHVGGSASISHQLTRADALRSATCWGGTHRVRREDKGSCMKDVEADLAEDTSTCTGSGTQRQALDRESASGHRVTMTGAHRAKRR